MSVLFIATVDNGTLPKASLEALTAATSLATGLGTGLIVGLVGAEVSAAANAIAGCGAEKMLGVAGADFSAPRYSSDTAAITAICQAAGADYVVGAATSRLARTLPGVAQRIGGRVDTQLTGLGVEGGKPKATRWFYRQRMFGDVTRDITPWVMTLAPGVFEVFEGAGTASLEMLDVSLDAAASKTEITGVQAPAADAQTIRPDSNLLLVAGAGWTKKQADGQTHVRDAKDLILGFLGSTKASLGSSKSLVDMGGEGQDVLDFLTHMHQVGQTGATPRHAKGLSTCCHGEEPHVVGWRFINERRAINTDAGCGWAHGKADVLYVGDAFEIMKKVNALLAG